MRKLVIVFFGMALIAIPAYLARDLWISHAVEEIIRHQANVKINHEISISELAVNSDQRRLSLNQVSLMTRDDPESLQSFRADRLELDADVSGLFSPHVRVKHARAYDVDVTLEYIAPGVSNFKLMEQTFRSYVAHRRAEGRSRLLEWDLDQLNLYRVHFTLIDIGGQVLADVQIPEIQVSTLSTKNSGQENFSILMSQIQKSVFIETLKGKVQGNYDTSGLLQLVRRELPQSSFLENSSVNKLKEAGTKLLEGWLNK